MRKMYRACVLLCCLLQLNQLSVVEAQNNKNNKNNKDQTPPPSRAPSVVPSRKPSSVPSRKPSYAPSNRPSTSYPSQQSTSPPSTVPSSFPSAAPPTEGSFAPSSSASSIPPSMAPSMAPSTEPSKGPSVAPSMEPSTAPSMGPAVEPTVNPSRSPSATPSTVPSMLPSAEYSQTPSEAPSGSSQPTDVASSSPSLRPSDSPSQQPSPLRSSSPSALASEAPSTRPSLRPSQRPSQKPSLQASEVPSQSPSSTFLPSAIPSEEPSRSLSVPMPLMQFDFVFSSRSTIIDQERLNKVFELFLTEFFSTSTGRKAFLSLETGLLLQNGNKAIVTGVVLYKGEEDVPTEGELKGQLMTYFSFWGAQELTSYLTESGIPVDSVSVTIDSSPVVSIQEDPRQIDATGDSEGKDRGWLMGLVIGVAAAAILTMGLLAFVQHRRIKSRHAEHMQQQQRRQQSSPVQANRGNVLPYVELSAASMDDVQSLGGLSGMYSTEESLFTAGMDAVVSKSPPPSYQYDASRLDQVISDAKFTSEMED